jgi:hypothetical protein
MFLDFRPVMQPRKFLLHIIVFSIAIGFTSREKLIASITIAGAYEIDSPVVIIALVHYFIFAGDT